MNELRRSVTLVLLVVAYAIPSAAQAGLLKVSVDKGTSATVSIEDFPEDLDDPLKKRTPIVRTDKNNDGIIEFSLDPQGPIALVMVEKVTDGDKIKFTLRNRPGEVTFASLEPFDLPTFADVAGEELVTDLFAADFLLEPVAFTPGEILPVAGGSISRTDALRFTDTTGNPFDGEARVAGFDQFLESVPEPGLFGLTALAVLLTFRLRTRTFISRALSPKYISV